MVYLKKSNKPEVYIVINIFKYLCAKTYLVVPSSFRKLKILRSSCLLANL